MLRRLQLLRAHAHDLHEADGTERRRDRVELRVVGHQHVLDARLAPVERNVPGNVVTTVHLVLCNKSHTHTYNEVTLYKEILLHLNAFLLFKYEISKGILFQV